jgi:hypothetical protein
MIIKVHVIEEEGNTFYLVFCKSKFNFLKLFSNRLNHWKKIKKCDSFKDVTDYLEKNYFDIESVKYFDLRSPFYSDNRSSYKYINSK